MLRIPLSSVAVLLLCGSSSAGPIEALKPGEWYEVPNSHLQRCSERARTAQFPDVREDQFRFIMDAWCGGAFDTKRDRLLVGPGGGHASYSTNEVYYFDLNDLAWHRLTDPDANTGSCADDPSPPPDVAPFAMHTYDGVEYLPGVDRYVVVGGWCTPYTYSLDLSAPGSRWTVASKVVQQRTGDVSAYDPSTGCLYYGAGSSGDLARFDPLTGTWSTLARGMWSYLYRMTGVIDPKRHLFVMVGQRRPVSGESGVRTVSLGADRPALTIVDTTGDVFAESGKAPGTEYDPIVDRIVCWNGGPDVYALDLDTGAWTRHPPAAGSAADPGAPNPNGTYGRFRYSPNKNVFVLVNSTNTNVFLYRHAIKDASVATVPANLSADATSPCTAHLRWDASSDPESGVMGYCVYRDGVQVGRVPSPAFDDTGLAELTTYAYTVSAVNGAYAETARSAPVSVRTPADTTPPIVVDVRTRADPKTVLVVFDEKVRKTSAEVAANYTVSDGVTVSKAALGSDGRTVALTVSDLDASITYTLVVENVVDLAATPHAVARSPRTFAYLRPVVAINCGGPRYVGADGTVYLEDTWFSGGSPDTGNAEAVIADTDDPTLYRTNRFGNCRYAIPLANGSYRVVLKFAETYYSSAGRRVFHVQAEGTTTGSIDLVARAGTLTALDTTLPVTVSDGVLDLSFVAETDVSVSAIAVTTSPRP